jgi:hypothetical protein
MAPRSLRLRRLEKSSKQKKVQESSEKIFGSGRGLVKGLFAAHRDLDMGRMAAQFFAGGFPEIGKGTHDDRQETMIMDENLARLRAHRNNIHRYRRLLATQLTDLERAYIERRLEEEHAAMAALSEETFPFTLPPAAAVPAVKESRYV